MCKLVVGLGNPKKSFERNRHNIGFTIVDALISHHKANKCYLDTPRKPMLEMHYKVLSGELVLFLKPRDWMNSSGKAVGRVARQLKLDPKDILLIHDDMDFDFGIFKIKGGGSSGRHNGVQSVIDAVGKNFARFRIGIGRPDEEQTAYEYVLSDFRTWEQKRFCELFGLAIQVVDTFVAHGVQQTMNIFNRRNIDDGREEKEA